MVLEQGWIYEDEWASGPQIPASRECTKTRKILAIVHIMFKNIVCVIANE